MYRFFYIIALVLFIPCIAFCQPPANSNVQTQVKFTAVPLQVYYYDHCNTIEIRIYNKKEAIGGLVRPKLGKYFFFQSKLRDKKHEELVFIALSEPFREITDIFIIGLDKENEITLLPIINNCNPHFFINPHAEIHDNKIIIPYSICSKRQIVITWSPDKQAYIVADNQ